MRDYTCPIAIVKKESKLVTSCYLIEHNSNRYFIKRTKNNIYLSSHAHAREVKKFLTEKLALAKLKTIHNFENYKVVYI